MEAAPTPGSTAGEARPFGAIPVRGPQQVATTGSERLPIRFTGSGSEYFRIWIVNVLLTVLTLSLYYPWARVRRLRYFQGNTTIGGQPLAFHGVPRQMLRGYLLVMLFGLSYGAASRFSPAAAAVGGVALAGLWPALWRGSLRFRLANSSWRGVRMNFTGSVRSAYAAVAPVLLPVAVLMAASALDDRPDPSAQVAAEASGYAVAASLSMLAIAALAPWIQARMKAYQHGHYRYAGETTWLEVGAKAFYGLSGRLGLVGIGIGIGMLVVGALVMAAAGRQAAGALAFLVLAFYLLVFVVVQPYAVARLQNLVWGHTRSARLQFHSDLRTSALINLKLKNLVLMALTLGLYWPFAAIATARLRLESMTVEVAGPVDDWIAHAAAAQREATGDAAADLLDVDVGL